MADVHDEKTRSYNMSRIKGKNTKPEMIVRKFLFSHGFRYKLHDRKLAGKPDIVLPKYRTVVFVHGCFWHGHENCKYYVLPKTRTEWWLRKIQRNKQLDKENYLTLTTGGWNVVTIYECEITAKNREETLNNLNNQLREIHSQLHEAN